MPEMPHKMDIFAIFTNYLLTISELFGYILAMQRGERKKRLTMSDFFCVCGNDTFDVRTCEADYTEGREKYEVITCSKCGCKFMHGKTEDNKLIVLRQPVMSDVWERDVRGMVH